MIDRANLILILFGFGLALVIGLIAVLLSSQQVALAACEPASGDWAQLVYSLMGDFREPCDDFYWLPEPDDEFHNHIRLNNFGLHDTMLTLEKPDGVYRVLIVGDSMAQGWQVTLEQGFPYLVEQQLIRDSGSRVQIVNLSIDAYGTDRELLLYSVLGWRFQPDLVLLPIYVGNDVQDNEIDLETRRYGYRLERPFFTLEDGALSLHHSPIFSPARYDTSAAYLWLTRLQAQQGLLPRENPPPVPRVVSESPYMLEYPVELGLYLPEDAYWSNAWALTEALVVQMRDLAQAQGSRFAAAIIPDRRAVHSEDWGATLQEFPFLQADPVAPVTRMEELLARHEITTLNMTWDLRAWVTRNPGERLYYAEDGHLNANGHAVTAQRIANWLRAEELAP